MACTAGWTSPETYQLDKRRLQDKQTLYASIENTHAADVITLWLHSQQSVPLVGGGRSEQEPGLRGMETLHRDPVLSHSVYW